MNSTKITYNKDNDEFRVRLFVDGEYQAGADYFTSDKEDAKGTAKLMEKNGGKSDKNSDFAKQEQSDYDEENDLIMYDVCNDYSLDEATTEFKPELYRTVKHEMGTVYIHKEYNEIHYLKGKRGLNGKYLYR